MKLYRYVRGYYSEEFYSVEVYLHDYEVLKETPQGYWIKEFGANTWVSKTAKKRFAYPTTDEAWINFIARTKRAVLILKAQLRKAESFLTAKKPERKNELA